MNQQLNSIFENLSSNLRKKSQNLTAINVKKTENQEVINETKVNKKEETCEKSKNIFKSFMNYNGASNIFSNLLKYSDSESTTTSAAVVNDHNSSQNTCDSVSDQLNKNGKMNSHNERYEDEASQHKNQSCSATSDFPSIEQITKKRTSVVKVSMELNQFDSSNQTLTPTPGRSAHRKSCHDIRLMKNNHHVNESGEETGKLSIVKPLKTRNIVTKNETFDMLYPKSMDVSFDFFSFRQEAVESHFQLTE